MWEKKGEVWDLLLRFASELIEPISCLGKGSIDTSNIEHKSSDLSTRQLGVLLCGFVTHSCHKLRLLAAKQKNSKSW